METLTIRPPQTDADWQSYFHCRWWLLRAPWGRPKGSEQDGQDCDVWNWGIWQGDRAVGCVRLQEEAPGIGRLRYMAVAPELRRTGLGKKLVQVAEETARQERMHGIILDARQPAVGFYKKLGYQIDAEAYLLFNTIKHYAMSKYL